MKKYIRLKEELNLYILPILFLVVSLLFFVVRNKVISNSNEKTISAIKQRKTQSLRYTLENVKIRPLNVKQHPFQFYHCDIEIYDDFILLIGFGKFFKNKIILKPILLYTSNKIWEFNEYLQFEIVKIKQNTIFKDELEITVQTAKNKYDVNNELTLKKLTKAQIELFTNFWK